MHLKRAPKGALAVPSGIDECAGPRGINNWDLNGFRTVVIVRDMWKSKAIDT